LFSRVGAALCFWLFTTKIQLKEKKQKQCAASALDKKHDRKNNRRDGERKGKKDRESFNKYL
jgi:hypothetical protein